MVKLNWRALVGVLMVILGVLAMLQTTHVIKFEGDIWLWVFASLFGVAGLGFLYVLISAPKENWWASIPGLTLVGLGTLMALEGMPGVKGDWPVTIFMGCIGLSFVLIYWLDRSRWWAIIPGGTLLSVALMILLPSLGGWTASILFFGMAATFGAVALLGKGKMNWGWYPAVALLALGLFIPSVEGAMPWMIWPVILIVAGGYLILRTMLKK